jgi:hypothetical protein
VVLHLVVGRVKGIACVLARTERRLVVVADRPGRPLVESLHPATPVRVQPVEDGTAVVVVVDRLRQLRIEGVRDRAEARALAQP